MQVILAFTSGQGTRSCGIPFGAHEPPLIPAYAIIRGMEMKVFNSLTRREEPLKPLADNTVRFYTCGPTVYNFAHIGNFRAYTFEDILRRVIQFNGMKVKQVMNLTDVDDKTIRGANAAGVALTDYTKTYKDAFFADLKKLNIQPAEVYPAATDHIPEMISLVEKLVEKLKEINCSVLGDYYDCQASVCEAPVRSGEILSYEDKYLGGGKNKPSEGMHSTVREIPARLPEDVSEFIRTTACKTFRVLACDGVSRIDFMIDEATGGIYVNEINTIPGSLSFYLWEATGIKFDELVDRLVAVAFKRKRDSEFKTTSYSENIFAYQAKHGAKLGGAKGSKN